MNNFCPNCGKENKTNSNFCPNCGTAMNDSAISTPNVSATEKTNGLALAGFITALVSLLINFWGIVGIVATILSGVGLSKTGPGKEKGRGMAIAGLIIGIFSILYGVIQLIALAELLA